MSSRIYDIFIEFTFDVGVECQVVKYAFLFPSLSFSKSHLPLSFLSLSFDIFHFVQGLFAKYS